ncbi:MAG: triple tyrosine motif-containing protein [Clostridium sp.]
MSKKFCKRLALFVFIMFSINIFIPVGAEVEAVEKANDIILKIENPSNNHGLTGNFYVKGYAVSKKGIKSVEISVDGGKWIDLGYGTERKDIHERYPDYKDSINSGYGRTLSGVKNGKHNLVVQAIDNDGNKAQQNIVINVDNKLTSVMGQGKTSSSKMKHILYDNNNGVYTKNQIDDFVDYTIKESNIEDVNYDVAFALMMVETGYLNFGGDVKPNQNNFGGLGATGNGNPGESFKSMQIGIRAVIQHMKAYASKEPLKQTCVDPRFKYVKRESAKYIEYLGIKENPNYIGWAAGKDYGTKIKNMMSRVSNFEVINEVSKLSKVEALGSMLVNDSITIKATASPAESTLYKFMVKQNGVWKTIKDYSTSSSVKYTPKNSGKYAFQVLVKNKTSDKSYDDIKATKEYAIKEIKSSNPTITIKNEFKLNNPVNIIVGASPKETSLYKIMVKENGRWRTLSDYSSTNNIRYTPKSSGKYAFQVLVKNKNSSTDKYDTAKSTSYYEIDGDSKVEGLSVKGDMIVGKKLTITATATPKEKTLYKIMVKENGKWKVISDYSKRSTVEYTPKTSGNYAFQVLVRHEASNKVYDSAKSTTYYKVIDVKSKDAKISISGKVVLGESIKINVDANPSNDSLYKIMVKENGSWKTLSDYSSNKSINYTINKPGKIAFQVLVKNKNSNSGTYDSAKSTSYYNVEAKSVIKDLNVKGDMIVGNSINISSAATPDNDTLYKIMVKENGVWKTVSDFSEKSKVNYTPAKTGKYAFQVLVKHKQSSKKYDTAKSTKYFNITEKTSKNPRISLVGKVELGSEVSINVTADPNENTLYKIMVKENGSWKTISDFSSKNNVSYRFTRPGKYAFQVLVKNKNSATTSFDAAKSTSYYDIVGSVNIKNVSINGEFKVGKTINIKTIVDHTTNTEYKFMVKENGIWKTIKDYSNSSSASYKFTKPGKYAFQVLVRNEKNSDVAFEDIWASKYYTVKEDTRKTILIDAGHGSGNKNYDNGDVGSSDTHYGVYYEEGKLNLQVAQKLKSALEKKGFNVLMTRGNSSDNMELRERARYANRENVDLVISIHQNSFDSNSHGVEVLVDPRSMDSNYRKEVIELGYTDPNKTHSKKVSDSRKLASIVVDNLARQTGFRNRGVKDQMLTVMRNSKCPAILVECGFISNPNEAKKLANSNFQQGIANSIANSVVEYFN